MPRRQYLLIFDLNGTLLHRVNRNDIHLVRSHPITSDLRHECTVNGRYIYLRPHLKRFLTELSELFHLGVWTSGQQNNMEPIVTKLEACCGQQVFRFAWYRHQCDIPDPERFKESYKDLTRLWQDPPPSLLQQSVKLIDFKVTADELKVDSKESATVEDDLITSIGNLSIKSNRRKPIESAITFDERNTVLVDDTDLKADRQPRNHLRLPTFEVTNHEVNPLADDYLNRLLEYLRQLHGNQPEDIRTYLKDNSPPLK